MASMALQSVANGHIGRLRTEQHGGGWGADSQNVGIPFGSMFGGGCGGGEGGLLIPI